MSQRPRRKRLAIEIPEDLHRDIKALAAVKNITMTRYVIRALLRYYLDRKK